MARSEHGWGVTHVTVDPIVSHTGQLRPVAKSVATGLTADRRVSTQPLRLIDELSTIRQEKSHSPRRWGSQKSLKMVFIMIIAFVPPLFSISLPFLVHHCLLIMAKHCACCRAGKGLDKGFVVRCTYYVLFERHSASALTGAMRES